jgi:dTDP-glucose pyrophosphorylase
MKSYYKKHLISSNSTVKQALKMLNELAADAIIFVVDDDERLIGSLTDGDVRRGLIENKNIDENVSEFIQPNPKFILKDSYCVQDIIEFKSKNFKIIPVVDEHHKIINVINFRLLKSYLPIASVIMAGGKGERLRPLTETTPKPMLKVGDKPILEHQIDSLQSYGIDDIWISINYLGDQIRDYFKDGYHKGMHIEYIEEKEPLGTIGSVSLIEKMNHDTILISNSDLLTNIDYEKFYLKFLEQKSDMMVLSIPYTVSVPYAVLETEDTKIKSFREKPSYAYFANAGIYLIKKEMLSFIPKNMFFNATDLIEILISNNKEVHAYPYNGYWLDIGRHDDFEKANIDIENLKF